MAIVLSRPSIFSGLEFNRTPTDKDGYYSYIAPCGCSAHHRRVIGGPLSGHTYGDAMFSICSSHVEECPECGYQTWPHSDCICPDAEPEQEQDVIMTSYGKITY